MIWGIFNNIAPKAYLESIALKLFRPESLQKAKEIQSKLKYHQLIDIETSNQTNKKAQQIYNPHSALQLLRHILVTKTRQFDDTTDRNSLIAVTQN